MSTNSIVDRVKAYFKDTFIGSDDKDLREMAELSGRAVAVVEVVYDEEETNVYFDAASYKLTIPKIWTDSSTGKCSLFPSELDGTGLGVLLGIGRASAVKGFDDALGFASRHLEPIVEEAK